jgi:DNA polymerase III alpha subunit|tara:strand:- start:83 stop:826 length:744 start_codon:yes stop_codon:yes gene_type:complete
MVPLFKTHYSIGKSILTATDPASIKEGGADSVIQIAIENNLDKLVLVEDNFHGFLESKKRCDEHDIQLVFGLRLSVCNSHEDDKKKNHKVIIFAKNDHGCKKLYKIHSQAFCDYEQRLTFKDLKEHWTNNLLLAIPFYDSFLHRNNFSFAEFIPDFSFVKPLFFLENNQLPFDHLLRGVVEDYCARHNYNTEESKTIYYKNKKDFAAYQTFKIICNRSFSGRKSDLTRPNLDHCGSQEFCMESFLEQ